MKYFKLLILSLLIIQFRIADTYGQQVSNQSSFVDKTIIAGNFEIHKNNRERGLMEHINVNYVLSPVPFGNVMKLQLSTPDPLLFTADIVDSRGTVMIHWAPNQKSYSYNETIDLSGLNPGSYHLNVYCEYGPALLHSIAFQKENK